MRPRARQLTLLGIYAFLTLIVWGLFALDRGFVNDELWILNRIAAAPNWFAQLFNVSFGTPTRHLTGVPFTIAFWTGDPAKAAQLIYGLTWLASGVLVHLLVRVLVPERPLLAYLCGCLTLTATGDFGTNYLGALSYQAVACYQAALLAAVIYCRRGRARWLIAAVLLLQASLWSGDNAQLAAIASPLFLWAGSEFQLTRRVRVMCATWLLALVPYLVVFVAELSRSSAYVYRATGNSLSPDVVAHNWLYLFSRNFAPWTWAWLFDRPELLIPQDVIPAVVKSALVVTGAVLFLAGGWLFGDARSGDRTKLRHGSVPVLYLAVAAVMMAAIANLNYAPLVHPELVHRTQLLSRVFASLAIGLFAGGLGQIVFGRSSFALWLALPFVALGLRAGLASQDFYLSMWMRHANEIRSIVEQVPRLAPDARVVFYVPPDPPHLALAAPFVAGSWLEFASGDRSLPPRVYLWKAANACRPEADGLTCSNLSGTETVRYDRLVFLAYDRRSNRFVLQEQLPAALGVGLSAGGRYAPLALIGKGPLPPRARRVLYGSQILARLLPVVQAPIIEPLAQLDPALNGSVLLDPFVKLPWDYDGVTPPRLARWLGEGEPGGYGGALWSERPRTLRFIAAVQPGPGRRDLSRTFRLALRNASGTWESTKTVPTGGELELDLRVEAGRTDYTISVIDPVEVRVQPNGDRRPLMAWLARIDFRAVPDCSATLRDGWYAREPSPDGWLAWVRSRGILEVTANREMEVALYGTVLSAVRPNDLVVSVNGRAVFTADVGWQAWGARPFGPVRLGLRQGSNIVEFASQQPPIRVAGESRPLGIAIGRITLQPATSGAPCEVRLP